ncbi:MAG: MATE family efflux transporter, partial [Clostridia bacterium]|nr:MATE family efflux transporter [Clostridia bacterium]
MERNMTEGGISGQIVSFAVPIILGNIFQQLYNTADAMIVGRILGKDAFAAVSVANPIMSVVLFFLVGLTMGVG